MLKDEIQNAINKALKERNKTELKVLRFVLSQIQYEEIDKRKELSDGETVAVLQKEVKKRNDAIEMFKKGERPELVEDEQNQVKIIERYLPKQMGDEEINRIIEETIITLDDKSNIGKTIGLVMAKLKGRADGGKVARLVKQKLISS